MTTMTTTQHSSGRLGLPPPLVLAPTDVAPSASTFVAKTLLAAMAIVLGVASIAAAPLTVTVPLAVALVLGLAATGLVATGDRMLARLRRARDTPSPRPLIDTVWKAVVAGSVAVLMVALVLPEGPRVVLALLGFAGLMLFRLAAMYGGWAPRYTGIRRASAALGQPTRSVSALMHGNRSHTEVNHARANRRHDGPSLVVRYA